MKGSVVYRHPRHPLCARLWCWNVYNEKKIKHKGRFSRTSRKKNINRYYTRFIGCWQRRLVFRWKSNYCDGKFAKEILKRELFKVFTLVFLSVIDKSWNYSDVFDFHAIFYLPTYHIVYSYANHIYLEFFTDPGMLWEEQIMLFIIIIMLNYDFCCVPIPLFLDNWSLKALSSYAF